MVLDCFNWIIDNFFVGLWGILSSIEISTGLSYATVIIGFFAVSFVICKFWKFGRGD